MNVINASLADVLTSVGTPELPAQALYSPFVSLSGLIAFNQTILKQNFYNVLVK